MFPTLYILPCNRIYQPYSRHIQTMKRGKLIETIPDLKEVRLKMFFEYLHTFQEDESGAVTVDWVVLTAAIVGLGIAVITAVSASIGSNTDSIVAEMAEVNANVDIIRDNANGSTN